MKLKLTNFRCHTSATFDFGEKGLTLISGSSGVGKSTLLQAIYYALYGSGRKLPTYGKSSCKVELEFGKLNIVRTKVPNRVMVNEQYEDTSGQNIIDQMFGHNFDVIGYIEQNNAKSFVMMTPLEKLSFLERFAFYQIDLAQVKSKCKAISKEREAVHISSMSQLELAQKVLAEKSRVDFPLKTKNREKAIRNEQIRHKNTTLQLARERKKLTAITTELSDLKELLSALRARKEHIASVTEDITNCQSQLSQLSYSKEAVNEIDRKLRVLGNQKHLRGLERKYEDKMSQYQQLLKKEERTRQEKLAKIERELWVEYGKDEIHEHIQGFESYLHDMERLEELQGELKEIDERDFDTEIAILERKLKPVYSCPSCQSRLRVEKNQLVLTTDEENKPLNRKKQSTLKSQIDFLKEEKETYVFERKQQDELSTKIEELKEQYEEIKPTSEIRSELDYLRNYLSTQLNMEKTKDELERKQSSMLDDLKTELEQTRERIRVISEETEDEVIEETEGELISFKAEQLAHRDQRHTLQERIKNLNKQIDKYQTQNDQEQQEFLSKHSSIKSPLELEEEKVSLENSIASLEIKEQTHQENLDKIQVYLEYQKWEAQVSELTQKERLDRRKLTAVNLLKTKILQAESIAIANVIESINTHARIFLELFFPEDPIDVQLVPFKQSKQGDKPQINLVIEYKGMNCDINMLSGGEQSRVVLAFTLALAEMFNTPLIMLDECTASLDQELTEIVVRGIKEHFGGEKLVIMIAHQCVEAQYDRVVKLN